MSNATRKIAQDPSANSLSRKRAGAYFTPDLIATTLTSWVIRKASDRLLDPSCGDGRFIQKHRNSVGIEQNLSAAREAMLRAPWALVHEGEFFSWASNTNERFECAAGNPPFIRYQTFKGDVRDRALNFCKRLGVDFTGLASSWAPFLVAAASLLKQGGRIAFVVPAEIGHAPYAAPLLEYLVGNFDVVHLTAIREKLFPDLSEDCWLLYAEGWGGETFNICFSVFEAFEPAPGPPDRFEIVPVNIWRSVWKRRLRPFLLAAKARALYQEIAGFPDSFRFGNLASVGIGYVSGANDFFHLRPSAARRLMIPDSFLRQTVRNGRVLPPERLTLAVVNRWVMDDEPVMLLHLPKSVELPVSVRKYLDTEEGRLAREGYKCRNRDPWYSVPDVQVPDFFLTYMSGREPILVRNLARCTGTNSVHVVRLKKHADATRLWTAWRKPFVKLSCEIEGHPLGGGMLKLEPREAAEIVLPGAIASDKHEREIIEEAILTLRSWRHYALEP
jgi:adenine-specific DNA-methyltransferase